MKIIFFGTSSFAAKILQLLLAENEEVVAVVTRPDRPKGRFLKTACSPVKEIVLANHLNLPIFQPEKASDEVSTAAFQKLNPDLFVVVAYGEIIKQNLLNVPRFGAINIHASLLPKYRGAAPIQRALMNGDKETGITIINMVAQMDAGDILGMETISISEDMTFGELHEKLEEVAGHLLLKILQDFKSDSVQRLPQDERFKTLAPKLSSEDQKINWQRSALDIHNQIRALSPFPGAWASLIIGKEEKRVKITRSLVIKDRSGEPGVILQFDKEGWIIGCGEGALRLLEVQLEGKKLMKTEEFIRGMKPDSIKNMLVKK